MTPEKKQEINRAIAEELGLKYTKSPFIHGQKIVLANPEKVYVIGKPPHLFNPVDSISDALEAVDVLIPNRRQLIMGWVAGRIIIQIFTDDDEILNGQAETRSAAVSLALVQYIKEK